MKILEKDIVKMCLDYLTLKKIFHYRQNTGGFKTERGSFVRFGFKGSPDIVVVINGKYIGLECKVPNGKQSDGQIKFEQELKSAGGDYHIITNYEDLKKLIEGYGGN